MYNTHGMEQFLVYEKNATVHNLVSHVTLLRNVQNGSHNTVALQLDNGKRKRCEKMQASVNMQVKSNRDLGFR